MFVIFDGEAEFTVDGRTSLLKGTVGAPVRMGHSHAIYNPGKTPVEFMNINVSAVKGKYDAFDLDDARVGAPKDAAWRIRGAASSHGCGRGVLRD